MLQVLFAYFENNSNACCKEKADRLWLLSKIY